MRQDLYSGKTSSYLRTSHLRQSVQATLGKVSNWFQGTRIYSYFERPPSQFRVDLTRVHVSLKLRPRNWHIVDRDFLGRGRPACLYNDYEKMEVWIANAPWGLHFKVDHRYYGGVIIGGICVKWRRNLFKLATEMGQSPWVRCLREEFKK